MLVEMPTVAQAEKVAAITGWPHLPGKTGGKLSKRLDSGHSFEAHRANVEAVSVLFKLFDPRPSGDLVQIASGWTITASKFEVEWPANPSVIHSHFGGRRFAYNWALGRVKADMDAKTRNPGYEAVRWDLASLRKAWNQIKAEVAPWWEDNSKECYSSGIADLATALSNWKASKDGKRKGRKVGFPEFKSRNLDRSRVRFTTGGMRLEDDRRHITLPVIGTLRSKENTRNVQRPIAKGYGRLLNMTLSERWGRLFVSVNYAVRTPNVKAPVKPGVRSGVDLGLRTLATAADTEGNIIETANPAPLRATLAERRRVGKQLSRRIPGSIGHRQAKTKLGRLDRRAVHIRRETWHSSTTWLVSTYGEIVVEDLDIAAMKKGMGRRAFRRSVFDAALGMAGPMLEYKKARTGTVVIKADRWFASSQIHHGCGCRLPARTKIAKQLVCTVSSETVDRDINAAKNLRDCPEAKYVSYGSVGAVASVDTRADRKVGTDPGSDAGPSGAGGVAIRPCRRTGPAAVRPKPNQSLSRRRGGTPKGVPET